MSQRILVTAGASGIGLAGVEAFVAAGARVHVADVDKGAFEEVVRAHELVTGGG